MVSGSRSRAGGGGWLAVGNRSLTGGRRRPSGPRGRRVAGVVADSGPSGTGSGPRGTGDGPGSTGSGPGGAGDGSNGGPGGAGSGPGGTGGSTGGGPCGTGTGCGAAPVVGDVDGELARRVAHDDR